MRVLLLCCAVLVMWPPALAGRSQNQPVAERPPFDAWLENLVAEAKEEFSDDLVARTLSRITPLQRVIREDRSQAELVVGFERYYRSRVNARVVTRGREMARQHRTLLSRIEARYDVQRRFLLAKHGKLDYRAQPPHQGSRWQHRRTRGGLPRLGVLPALVCKP